MKGAGLAKNATEKERAQPLLIIVICTRAAFSSPSSPSILLQEFLYTSFPCSHLHSQQEDTVLLATSGGRDGAKSVLNSGIKYIQVAF